MYWIDHQQNNRRVRLRYQENGAKIVRAKIIYSHNGAEADSEWFPLDAKVIPGNRKNPSKVEATLPPRTTHYVYNLIDENNFMICYPELKKTDFAGTSLSLSR